MRVASKVGNLIPNLGMLGLWVLELFAMYETDRQTDNRTDKSNAFFTVGGMKIEYILWVIQI